MATVIRVIGSAPRPAGACMIVSASGRMAGSVSGGCVETTVYEELMDILGGGPPRTLRFGITDEMIWDVGLACGGTIDVHMQLLDPDLVQALQDRSERREPCVLAIPLTGELPLNMPVLVTAGGVAYGAGDGLILSSARQMLDARDDRGRVEVLAPGREVFFEPYLPPPLLILIGGVHVAIPLCRFATDLGFRVIVVDPRAKFANRDRFPDADNVLVLWPDEALEHLAVDADTYLVVLTHDPKVDEPALAAALKTDAAYIGAIGSRKTHAERFERLAKWDITAEQLERVYAPIGLDLGGISPEETALSIIAEVVAVKNGRSGGSLRWGSGRIGR